MRRSYGRLHLLWLSLLVILFDQVSKHLVLKHLYFSESITLCPFASITLVSNRGAAFSFLDNASGWQNVFFMVFAFCVCAGLLFWVMRLKSVNRMVLCGVGFVIGGAVGNVMDRVHYGYVIDFIDVHIKQYHWPVFNVADSAITLGVLCILIFGRQCER